MPRKRKADAAPEPLRMHIRWMIRRDMPEVLDIERRCFDPAHVEQDFLAWLRQRSVIGMVVEVGQSPNPPIAGFMIYELHKYRIEVLNFAVHPNYQRRGVGSAMIDKLLTKLASHRRTKVCLYVPDRRLGAQIFFRQMKFQATRIERSFYADGEDAYRMVLTIDGDVSEPVNRVETYLDETCE